MAETFKVGANARELLRYTQRATRIVTDDISRSDARKIIQKVAALEDVHDIQKVCGTAVHALDTRDREGFSKSTFRLYGEGIRLTARQILLDAHAANNVNFQTDYDKRVEKIGAVVDGCSLLLEYLTICTEEGIISARKAGIWTKKVTDVKYPAMKWLTSERGRAEKLRAEAERKRLAGLKILSDTFDPEEYAICIAKGNSDLTDKFNSAIEELQKDGTIDSITSNYIGDEAGKHPYETPDGTEYPNGTLTMATNAQFEPYEYYDGDQIVGIDADIAKAICDKLGYELKIEDMEFDAIIAAVSSGKADFGAAGITVTEDRKKNIDFTDTYTKACQVIVVRNK